MTSYNSSQLQMLATSIAWAIYEYVNLVLLLDAVGVYFCTSDLQAHACSLVRLTASIGDDLGTERSPDGISGKITTDSNGRIKNNRS